MKKIMFILLIAVGVNVNGFAQKGMQGIGMKAYMCLGGYDSQFQGSKSQTTMGGGLEYQYFLTDAIRVKPSAAYFSNQRYSMSEFSAALSFDYLIPVSTQFRPYLDLSVRYADLNCKISYSFDQDTDGKGFAFGGGAGLDIRLSYQFSLQLEMVALWGQGKQNENGGLGKTIIKKPVWLPSVGLSYNF